MKLKMKLKDLRTILRAEKVNLYVETGMPIKFEIWGLDSTGTLVEYRQVDEETEHDTMFLHYGKYDVDEIGVDTDGALYIGISI